MAVRPRSFEYLSSNSILHTLSRFVILAYSRGLGWFCLFYHYHHQSDSVISFCQDGEAHGFFLSYISYHCIHVSRSKLSCLQHYCSVVLWCNVLFSICVSCSREANEIPYSQLYYTVFWDYFRSANINV